MLGGAMRQSGVIAAAGLYALENNVERLAEDHANAGRLAQGLRESGFPVEGPYSNMVFAQVPAGMDEHLIRSGIKVLKGPRLRLVTHLDVDAAGIERALAAFRAFAGGA